MLRNTSVVLSDPFAEIIKGDESGCAGNSILTTSCRT
jgi:hypothetical protein